jgi:ATP-dependent Clp protease ATP-binding subunit ClpC
MLKPALARGELQCIGATTLDEYRKYIEKDGALERRFQPIFVNPPTESETIQIIFGLRDKYEAHHRAKITDEAVVAAVQLSQRYINDRFLPDKAIDVIDEAGSRARLSMSNIPSGVRELEKEIENVAQEKESCIQAQEFEKAASYRDKEKQLRDDLRNMQEEWKEKRKEQESVVDEEDIATVVGEMTGIPISRLAEAETAKLLRMEEELQKRIIGQDDAVKAVSRAVRRNRAGLRNPKRPIGSFIFLGPTGVGKTEMAKVLARFLFDDEDAMIRVDMSEYMEKFAVSRLIGAPPGYVGYDEGGQLTEKVRRKPYSVVLLDEIEKAHPDVYNILLQVIEDGQLTDSFGRHVDFKNTVLIMTSNVGARQLKPGRSGLGFSESEGENVADTTSKVKDEMKKIFNPEFLNRIDETIIFRPLARAEMGRILEIMTRDLELRLEDLEIQFEYSDAARAFLVEQGFDANFGARPLRRAIQTYLEDPLSEKMLTGELTKGARISIDAGKDKLEFTVEKKSEVTP